VGLTARSGSGVPALLAGNASLPDPQAFSVWSGGLLCVAAVAATCAALPGFVRYRAALAPSCGSVGSALSASETAR
jgi:hypothetical protein